MPARLQERGVACPAQLGFSLLLLATAAPPASSAPTPPPLPEAFSIRFNESFSGFPVPPGGSGAWQYDYPRRLWRADHYAPQVNNFCSCADNSTTASCALLFVPHGPPGTPYEGAGGLFVDFPNAPASCCWLCGADEGCTPLTPSWLSGGNYSPAGEDAQGCEVFCEAGDQATADCLSYRPGSDVPCLYTESFSFGPGQTVVHNLTFQRDTFRPGPPPPDAFRVRQECAKPCPRLFPAQCG
jgi:hypothetical protein